MNSSEQIELAGRLIELVRAAAPRAEAEATVDVRTLALTRFANSMIHQNVADETATLRLKIHADGRTISSSTTLTALDALDALVARTIASVGHAPLDPSWPGLAPAAPLQSSGSVDPAIVSASPKDRAERVRDFVDAAGGLTTAGFCQTRHLSSAFVNSAGQSVAGASADVSLSGIARTATSDGAARLASAWLSDIYGTVLGARAAAKARAGVDPIELEPGRYEVVLEPTATNDIVQALAMYGFNGRSYIDHTSFLHPGDAQFDAAITIVDDAVSAGMIGLPFDQEGTPKRRIELVTAGRSVSPVYDRRTAAETGVESTGHGVGSAQMVLAQNLMVEPHRDGVTGEPGEVDGPAADSSVVALISDVARGVLVTDHWYTRVLDPRTLVMTGLTRNGVWLIENGEVTRPLRNFRFTQSYPEALGPDRVLGVGSHAPALPFGYGYASFRSPALRLASWNFTGGASG
jgi:predicted Zn-dependent protease